METLKVAKTSSISAVAGAIAKFLREEGRVSIQSIGNITLLRAVKSIALATKYMIEEGVVVASIVEFFLVSDGLSGIRFTMLVVGKTLKPVVESTEVELPHPLSTNNPIAN